MGAFICRQPNGKLCRFSTVIDTITDYNMTDEEYIEMCADRAREEARHTLEHRIKPYRWIDDYFSPSNMTYDELEFIKRRMESDVDNEIQHT
jgi:hypothetical protein